MKTEALVEALARGPIGVEAGAVERRLGIALLVGTLTATGAMLVALGPRPDLHAALVHAAFWIKLAYPASLAMLALAATSTLARPVGKPRTMTLALSAVTTGTLAAAPMGERVAIALGHSAATCVADVAALALPVFVLALAALRACAPTRLRAAGAAAGSLAGAAAAAVYAWHCDEMALPFVGIWYTLGMAIPAALGAALGPRVLRWA